MAHLTADRVKETTTTTGTGAITLAGAASGFRAFSSVLSINDTCYYAIAALSGTEWEVGIGTYSALNTLTRTTVLSSSNAGSAVTFSAGSKEIFITSAANRFLQQDVSGNIGIGIAAAATPAARLDLSGNQVANIVAVAALDINCSLGNFYTKTIAGNSTFTFSTVPASRAYSFILELTHTSGTVTWPATVQWPGATAPSLTTGKTHLFVFITDDGGTRWRGSSSVNYTN